MTKAKIRIAVPDLVSNSYFPIVAATTLGLMEEEGIDATIRLISPLTDCIEALKDGRIDVAGCSAHAPLLFFPGWKDVKLICAQSQGTYWILVTASRLRIDRGDLSALRGRRIAAVPFVGTLLRHLLAREGLDADANGIEIFMPEKTRAPGVNFGVAAAEALENGEIDGFFANGMAAEIATEKDIGHITLDIRRDQVPPEWFNYTMPAVAVSDRLISSDPDAVAAIKRGIIRVHAVLKRDSGMAAEAAAPLFPSKEATLISRIIARDLPFYDHRISRASVSAINDYSKAVGLSPGEASFDDVVALSSPDDASLR